MTLSVLIPSYGRPEKLRVCLEGLCRQSLPPAEVVVGLDGGTAGAAAALLASFGGRCPGLRVLALPKRGYIPTRARLLAEASAPVFLSLNDDVRVSEGLVEAHAAAHAGAGGVALVTGPAPWVEPRDATVFDRLVSRSDLIFFDPAGAVDDAGRVPYRYCVGLNFSCPTAAAREAGGFHDLPHAYGYDDIELAFRVGLRFGAPVLFAAGASVEHDHRYGPAEVMRREYSLGRAAWMYRRAHPEFAAALFGRDVAADEELAFCRETVRRTHGDAARIERRFLSWGETPAAGVPDALLPALAEHWIPLKRFLWRWGLLDEAEGRERPTAITVAAAASCGVAAAA